MMGRTHMAIGFLTGLVGSAFLDVNPVVFTLLTTFGSLLPDIDHEKSKINRAVPVTRWIPRIFKHRGFFHSLFPPVIMIFFFWQFNLMDLGLPLVVGYLSHLASDCLTKLGCNLLYPVSTFRVQGFVMTDGVVEFAILTFVIITNAVLVLKNFGF